MISRFITATGTGVGKTLVTAALSFQACAKGKDVRALKPVLTGLAETAYDQSDAAVLLHSLGKAATPAAIEKIAPFRFDAALAPSMAAAREKRHLDMNAVIELCRAATKGKEDILLVEGVGGVMVPLSEDRTVLDWMAALGFPAVLVAGSYLGTLSHTLTALSVLRQAKIPLAGIVVSETEGSPVTLDETVDALLRWASPVLAIPRIEGADPWRRAPDLSALLS